MKKRSTMSKKDALIEQAAMSAAGIQQTHVVGIFVVFFVLTTLIGLAGAKGLTWTILLAANLVLFGYLMKLTIDSGLNVPLGPDGEPIGGAESSDDEDDDYDEEEDYKAPAVSTKSGVKEDAAPVRAPVTDDEPDLPPIS